ncbi:MAG: hypothetical protein M0Z50_00935 [Planctomycetia bacterium]|nr:hypothetical protein [Planctomycetia bacterium]
MKLNILTAGLACLLTLIPISGMAAGLAEIPIHGSIQVLHSSPLKCVHYICKGTTKIRIIPTSKGRAAVILDSLDHQMGVPKGMALAQQATLDCILKPGNTTSTCFIKTIVAPLHFVLLKPLR